MRFRAPPAYEVREIHSPGALPAPYGPPPGFLTLLTAYALPDPAGLVSCRRRSWGFCPPELFPPNEAVAPLDARNPPAVDLPASSNSVTSVVDSFAARVAAGRTTIASSMAPAGGLGSRAWHLAGVR
jgi:hypothetical protein